MARRWPTFFWNKSRSPGAGSGRGGVPPSVRGQPRTGMIEPDHPDLSIGQQCKLLSIARSSFYYTPKGETEQNLGLMRTIDEQFLETPFFGVRQMTWHLRNDGHLVNEKRTRRLMRLMGLMPIYQKPDRSRPAKGHKTYPYLLTWETGSETKAAIRKWLTFYNHQRPRSALGGKSPALVYWQRNDIKQPDQQVQRVAYFTPDPVQETGSSSTSQSGRQQFRQPYQIAGRHRQQRAEASPRHTRRREKIMGRFKSSGQAQRFVSVHDQMATWFRAQRHRLSAQSYRHARSDALSLWADYAAELAA